jgi:hypothetical protein
MRSVLTVNSDKGIPRRYLAANRRYFLHAGLVRRYYGLYVGYRYAACEFAEVSVSRTLRDLNDGGNLFEQTSQNRTQATHHQ